MKFQKIEISNFKFQKIEISSFEISDFEISKFTCCSICSVDNGQSEIISQEGNTDSRIIFRKQGEREIKIYGQSRNKLSHVCFVNGLYPDPSPNFVKPNLMCFWLFFSLICLQIDKKYIHIPILFIVENNQNPLKNL